MNNIKYSILMPCYNRAKELRIALQTYSNRYKNIRNDYEFVIVEDGKNYNDVSMHIDLMNVLGDFLHLNITHFYGDSAFNPSKHFNQESKLARGEYFILTNPETAIMTDVLGIIDLKSALDESYIIGACANCDTVHFDTDGQLRGNLIMWYNHSIHRKTYWHFFSVIPRRLYEFVDGFDEMYTKGMSYDDNDFALSVACHKIPFIFDDDIYTMHIAHDCTYQKENLALASINREYYMKKWNVEDTMEAFHTKLEGFYK